MCCEVWCWGEVEGEEEGRMEEEVGESLMGSGDELVSL